MRLLGFRLVLLAGSSLAAFVFLELVARMFLFDPATAAPHHQLLCEPDPLLGWRKIAGASRRYRTVEYDIHERINAKGLRGKEVGYEKPSDVLRILVLGDSFSEGYTVEEDEIFTEVLRRRVASLVSRPVEVVNGGTSGYSTDQELLFYRSEGRRYSPDIVVLAFYENDVWFNAQTDYPFSAKPRFVLESGKLVLTNTPVAPRSPTTKADAAELPGSGLGRIRAFANDYSALYRVTRDRVRSIHWVHELAIRTGFAEPSDGPDSTIEMPDQWQVFRKEPTPEAEAAWRITEALLATLRQEVEADGARFLVVNIPPPFDLVPDQWSAIVRRYGIEGEEWSASTVGLRLAEISRAREFELFDLKTDFANAIAAGGSSADALYLPIDGHWTAAGHRLAGERIAEYLSDFYRHADTIRRSH